MDRQITYLRGDWTPYPVILTTSMIQRGDITWGCELGLDMSGDDREAAAAIMASLQAGGDSSLTALRHLDMRLERDDHANWLARHMRVRWDHAWACEFWSPGLTVKVTRRDKTTPSGHQLTTWRAQIEGEQDALTSRTPTHAVAMALMTAAYSI